MSTILKKLGQIPSVTFVSSFKPGMLEIVYAYASWKSIWPLFFYHLSELFPILKLYPFDYDKIAVLLARYLKKKFISKVSLVTWYTDLGWWVDILIKFCSDFLKDWLSYVPFYTLAFSHFWPS